MTWFKAKVFCHSNHGKISFARSGCLAIKQLLAMAFAIELG